MRNQEIIEQSPVIGLFANTPPAPWFVDTGTMADKMNGCWLIRSSKEDFPTWLLATSGHSQARDIAELVCMLRNNSEWIPVSERKPDYFQAVLVFSPLHILIAMLHHGIRRGDFWATTECTVINEPSHWMPLPHWPKQI